MRRPLLLLLVMALLVVPVLALAEPHVDGEVALEQRLLAPCCWVQTLDVHDSPIARELRTEIRSRLLRGEAPASIERDLVGRYGDRIVAMPASNPIVGTAVLVGIAVLAAGVLLLLLLRRWLKADHAAATVVTPTAAVSDRDQYDDRLDEELKDR